MDIDYSAFGVIVVEGVRYEGDVVIDAGVVRRRDKGPSRGQAPGHTPLSSAEDLPWSGPELIVGTGWSGMLPVLPDVAEEAARRGVALREMPTAEACRLIAEMEPAAVHALLHTTC